MRRICVDPQFTHLNAHSSWSVQLLTGLGLRLEPAMGFEPATC